MLYSPTSNSKLFCAFIFTDNTNSEMAKRNQFDGSDVSSSEDETQNSVLTHNSITSASFDSDSGTNYKIIN